MELNTEPQWLPIASHPWYEISDRGDVRNTRTNKILGRRIDKDGYRLVQLYNSGVGHNHKVHRLVAETFIGRDPDRDQVNHLNGNKEDNRVENLQWCTRSENTRHAYNELQFRANISSAIKAHTKLDERKIREIIRLREEGVSVKEIAERYNVSIYSIYRVSKKE